MKKRVLSILVISAIMLTCLASVAFAANTTPQTPYVQDFEGDSIKNAVNDEIKAADPIISIGKNAYGTVKDAVVTDSTKTGTKFVQNFDGFTAENLATIKKYESKISYNEGATDIMTGTVENGVLTLTKTGIKNNTTDLTYDLTAYTGTLADYTVELDFKFLSFTKDQTLQLTMGSDYAIRLKNSETLDCTIEYHNGSAWVDTDKTTYSFADFQHITLAVRTVDGVKYSDLYLGEGENRKLIYANVPQRYTSKNFAKPKFTLGKSGEGAIVLDNISVSSAVPERALYTADFDSSEEIPDGWELIQMNSAETVTTTASVSEGALVINKTLSGSNTSSAEYLYLNNYIGQLTEYSVSFDLSTDYSGSTAIIYLGAGLEVGASSDNTQKTLKYYNGVDESGKNVWSDCLIPTVDLTVPHRIKMVLKALPAVDIYLDGELIAENAPIRSGYITTQLMISLNNGLKGSLTIDNATVTRGAEDYSFPVIDENENHMLELSKYTIKYSITGVTPVYTGAATIFNFDRALAGALEHTLTFKFMPDRVAGNFCIALGVFFQFDRQSDGSWMVSYRPGAESSNTDIGTYRFDELTPVTIHIKNGVGALYINGELAVENIPPRNNYSFTRFQIIRNDGFVGALYLDDLSLSAEIENSAAISGVYSAGEGLTVSGYVPSSETAAKAYAGWYDSEHKLVGLETISAAAGEEISAVIDTIPDRAEYAKLILITDNLAPLCGNGRVSVK